MSFAGDVALEKWQAVRDPTCSRILSSESTSARVFCVHSHAASTVRVPRFTEAHAVAQLVMLVFAESFSVRLRVPFIFRPAASGLVRHVPNKKSQTPDVPARLIERAM